MRVNVSDIVKTEGAGIDVNYSGDLPGLHEFDNSVEFKPSFDFTGRIVNFGGLLKLSGKLHFEFVADCIRCLKPVETAMDIEVNEVFGEVFDPDEVDAYIYEGNVVDIEKPLIDNIILALPTKIICSEDCKGLCKNCGANLNFKNCNCDESEIVDSRMEILKDFFK
ncbi:DUF177 domain-containing protein [Ruminiclostridium herbifermentans]|uniref:DUF177 domain-containing protein n=1 Tax=Ruminiclostridium herbifermentans TaxID=2488810 RepID=A0A4U7JNW9_9FIRM|nr:DUF177 domain-containing protein [Ruminiclostridium herbifermentans]QNU68318.1 DUF177 domain-containing protein [Ruminiclostridium herbifermentans]